MYRIQCIVTDRYDAGANTHYRKCLSTAYAFARLWLGATEGSRKAVVSVQQKRKHWAKKTWRKVGTFRTAAEVPASEYARY